MKVVVYSIQQKLFEGESAKLSAFTASGQITILDQHIPLIAAIVGPYLELARAGQTNERIELSDGILEVRPQSEVVVLTGQASPKRMIP